jgi:uncharacterized damage-inducible protein DinB
MQLRQALLGTLNDARGWLKAWAGDFTDAEAIQAGGTKTNPAAWHLGHIAAAQDLVYRLFSGKPSLVPEAVRAVCDTGAPEPTAATRYPRVAELWALLDATHASLVALVEQAADDAAFDRPALTKNAYFHTLGQSIYEIALHETYHAGAVATLRKALGKKKVA